MAVDEPLPLSAEASALEAAATRLSLKVAALGDALGAVFVGARESVVVPLVHAALAGGHVLLEGVPGVGKTRLARGLASGLGLATARVQCTPDLMPSDVTGTEILETGEGGAVRFSFREGPIFANLVLADEINRATPKTQSALLEAMEEGRVTVGGTVRALPSPFLVIGTQNPIEMEGTYPLPEAQLDRFALLLSVPYPAAAQLDEILRSQIEPEPAAVPACLSAAEVCEIRELSARVLVADVLRRYLGELLLATQPVGRPGGASHDAAATTRVGASPRAGLWMLRIARIKALLAGRMHVGRSDLDEIALPALRHRVLLGFEARAQGLEVRSLLPTWIQLAAERSGIGEGL